MEFSGSSLQRAALTGDVTAPAGSNTTTIGAGAVTNTKLRDGVANSVIGRAGNSTGQVADISAGSDGGVLRLNGTTLGFGTLIAASFADNTIVAARLSATAQYRLFGRSSSGSGAGQEIASSADMFTLLGSANFSAARTNLGLAIGTNVQAWDADLDSLASASGTNTIYYRSAAGTWSPVTVGASMTFTGGTLESSGGSPASETVAGVLETATNSEWIARSATNKALVPSNLAARPSFTANKNGTNQTGIADITFTKVTMTNELTDIGGHYDAPNSEWTPPAGPVAIFACAQITGTWNQGNRALIAISKNGTALANFGSAFTPNANNAFSNGMWIDTANGTDVYTVEVFIDLTSGTGTVSGLTANTSWAGVWLG